MPKLYKTSIIIKIIFKLESRSSTTDMYKDTNSLYSYQCAITPEYQLTRKYTYLSLYLKEITPQKLISIQGKIKNGQIGTYSLIANVSYKGFTYLSTTSNSFFISSNSVQNLSNTQMTLKNYPINRG